MGLFTDFPPGRSRLIHEELCTPVQYHLFFKIIGLELGTQQPRGVLLGACTSIIEKGNKIKRPIEPATANNYPPLPPQHAPSTSYPYFNIATLSRRFFFPPYLSNAWSPGHHAATAAITNQISHVGNTLTRSPNLHSEKKFSYIHLFAYDAEFHYPIHISEEDTMAKQTA